ncbi:hypothetical protein GBA52_020772 [Prunus armeniaca]|nr:hypothetical protein GBA52_020772 [Prunus armeniaca]
MLQEEQEQLEQQPLSVPSMDTITTDDDMRLLLSDCEIGLMQDDLQFREDDPSEFSKLYISEKNVELSRK